jgi:hypothetical protein
VKKIAFLLIGAYLSSTAFADSLSSAGLIYKCPLAGDIKFNSTGHWEYDYPNTYYNLISDNFLKYPTTATLKGTPPLVVYSSFTDKVACIYDMNGVPNHLAATLVISNEGFYPVNAIGSNWIEDGGSGFDSCNGYDCEFKDEGVDGKQSSN